MPPARKGKGKKAAAPASKRRSGRAANNAPSYEDAEESDIEDVNAGSDEEVEVAETSTHKAKNSLKAKTPAASTTKKEDPKPESDDEEEEKPEVVAKSVKKAGRPKKDTKKKTAAVKRKSGGPTAGGKAKKPKVSDDEEESDTEYEVERILDVHFQRNGKKEFHVKWKGYSTNDSTWEPEDNLDHCKELITAFLAKLDHIKEVSPHELRVERKQTQHYHDAKRTAGVRSSGRFASKARKTYHGQED